MCGSMVDIQSSTAEIRRGKEEDRKKKPQGKNIMSASAIRRAAIIMQAFVTRAVSANILNLRRRQSLGEEDGGSEV